MGDLLGVAIGPRGVSVAVQLTLHLGERCAHLLQAVVAQQAAQLGLGDLPAVGGVISLAVSLLEAVELAPGGVTLIELGTD